MIIKESRYETKICNVDQFLSNFRVFVLQISTFYFAHRV